MNMGQISSSLRGPDNIWSRLEASYSPPVATLLVRAYGTIKNGCHVQQAHLVGAHCLARCEHEPMSSRQRMRVYYMLGLIHTNAGGYPLAIKCIDEALDCALALQRTGSLLIGLNYLRSIANAAQLHYCDSADDCSLYLNIIHDLRSDYEAASPLELDIYLELAMFDFALARFERISRCLDIDQQTATNVPAVDYLRSGTAS